MSNLSQFAGGVGYIDLEVFMIAGGGGAGFAQSPNPWSGGGGGAGGAYYGVISVKPASTCPITVGAVGATGASTGLPGSNGGDTSITCPVGTYRVAGGGGGGGWGGVPGGNPGTDGGCGGGASGLAPGSNPAAGRSIYKVGIGSDTTAVSTKNGNFYGYPGGAAPGGNLGGYPVGGSGGGAGGSGMAGGASALISDITGTITSYGLGGGGGGAAAAGVVVVRYPTQFAASSYTPAPAVTDLSPATPGYRTYKFDASASITLP
jgi:hypothetical protein